MSDWREQPLARAEIEAHIVAGRSNKQIAGRMRRPAIVVDWYERLFFDVRDRSEAYIEQKVIDPMQPMTPQDVRRIWAFWALHGGEHVLDAVLSDFQQANRPDYSHYFTERPAVGRDTERIAVQTAILDLILRTDPASESRIFRALVVPRFASDFADPNALAAHELNTVAESVLCGASDVGRDLKPKSDNDSGSFQFNAVANSVLQLKQTA